MFRRSLLLVLLLLVIGVSAGWPRAALESARPTPTFSADWTAPEHASEWIAVDAWGRARPEAAAVLAADALFPGEAP